MPATTLQYRSEIDNRGLPLSPREKFLRAAALSAAWLFIALAVSGIFAGLAGILFFRGAAPIGPVAAGLLLIATSHTTEARRRRRAITVLSYLEQAVRLNLPLPQMLGAAAQGEPPPIRRRLLGLRDSLEAGLPIARALQYDLVELNPRTIALIFAAERIGRLPVGLRRALATERSTHADDAADRVYLAFYPITVLLAVLSVAAMICVFVMPKFVYILRDFRMPIPWQTRLIVESGQWIAAVLVIILSIALILQIIRMMSRLLMPGRPQSNPVANAADALVWRLPVFGAVVRGRNLADLFAVIADALEAGLPLDAALGEAWELPLNRVLRRRLGNWLDPIHAGLPMGQAARAAGLPALVVGMVSTAAASGGLAHATRFLADHYAAASSSRLTLILAIASPAIALFLGVVVAFIALAMFMPMIRLIFRYLPASGAL